MNPVESILSAKDKLQRDGFEPVYAIIHPDHKEALGELKEICGIKIIIPSWWDLELLALYLGCPADSTEFWNPDNCYLLDQKAYDNCFNPLKMEIKLDA